MKINKSLLLCLGIYAVILIGSLFMIQDTGSAMYLLLIVIPVVNFVIAFISVKQKVNPILYLIGSSIISVATLYLMIPEALSIYIAYFIGSTVFGLILGHVFKR